MNTGGLHVLVDLPGFEEGKDKITAIPEIDSQTGNAVLIIEGERNRLVYCSNPFHVDKGDDDSEEDSLPLQPYVKHNPVREMSPGNEESLESKLAMSQNPSTFRKRHLLSIYLKVLSKSASRGSQSLRVPTKFSPPQQYCIDCYMYTSLSVLSFHHSIFTVMLL